MAAVQSLVEHMSSGTPSALDRPAPPPPNTDTWDLLLRAHIAIEDCDGLLVALGKVKQQQVYPRLDTLRLAYDLAQRLDHKTASQQLSFELNKSAGDANMTRNRRL